MRLLLVNLNESPENFHLEQAFIRSFNASQGDRLDILHHFIQSDYRFLDPVPNRTGFRLACPRDGEALSLLPEGDYDAALFVDFPLKRRPFLQFVRLALARRARRNVMVFNHLLPTPEQTRSLADMAQGRLLQDMDRIYIFDFEKPEGYAALGARPDRIALRPYALDCTYFSPPPPPVHGRGPGGEPLWSVFSAGSAGRDYDLLVQAMVGLGARLEVLSDAPGERLRSAADPRVRWEGFCAALPRLREAIARAAVVAVPVRAGFTNPTAGMAVALMGMAMEKPVVVRDTPALRRLIREGEDGFFYREGDLLDLHGRIEMLLADPGLCRVAGWRARRTALARASLERTAEQVLEDLRGVRAHA